MIVFKTLKHAVLKNLDRIDPCGKSEGWQEDRLKVSSAQSIEQIMDVVNERYDHIDSQLLLIEVARNVAGESYSLMEQRI